MRLIALAITLLGFSGAANAQANCIQYVGKTVSPVQIDEILEKFRNIEPKGEFETTEQFQRRRAASVRLNAGPLIIAKKVEDLKYFQYDADAGVLSIKPWGLSNIGFDAWPAFYSAGLQDKIKASQATNIQVAISRDEKVVGSYGGSNAYGAKAQVLQVNWTTKVIFDRAGQGGEQVFPSPPNFTSSDWNLGKLKLSPSEAQRIKPALKAAFVVEPKEPYAVFGKRRLGKPTMDHPREVTEEFSILIADIKCGLLLDGANKVLGSYTTN